MALPGFELLYSSVSNSLKSLDDASIAVVHWNLITNGLKCCGIGESWQHNDQDDQSPKYAGSELLPEGWNSDGAIYCLRYMEPSSDRKFLMKAVAMDCTLILHLIRCFDEKTVSSSIRSRDFVNDQYYSYQTAFTNLEEFNSQITTELYNSLFKSQSSTSSKKKSSSSSLSSPSSSNNQQQPGRSPLLEDPRRGVPPGGIGFTPPRHPFGGPVDPFSVGRADLDPLAGGRGGGMFMDPNQFPGRGGGLGPRDPFHPGHMGLPPGSVPPGARFDPIGPTGMRPNPNPDHERPPGYDDMFM